MERHWASGLKLVVQHLVWHNFILRHGISYCMTGHFRQLISFQALLCCEGTSEGTIIRALMFRVYYHRACAMSY